MNWREWLFVFGFVCLLGIVSADVISVNSGGSAQLIINPGVGIEGFFSATNEVPLVENVSLVSVDGTNESSADLNCSVLIYDVDSEFLNVTVDWFLDGVSQFQYNFTNQLNGSVFSSILDSGNLTWGDVWMCSVQFYDGFDYSLWGDSNNLTIVGPFEIRYSSFNGATTDFYSYNETELSNLSGVVLEKTSYGKIVFDDFLNITGMVGGDNIVDFDQDVEISDNLIDVNESNLSGINKSAILYIYNLDYIEPEIYHDGVNCSDCVLINYSGGNLVFSTPAFEGAYYVHEGYAPYCGDGTCNNGETCSSCPSDCGVCSDSGTSGGGSGGGSSGGPSGYYDFEINPSSFTVDMSKGTYYRKDIMITNSGSKEISIGISVENLDDFIFPEFRSVVLAPHESKTVRLDIYVSDQRSANVYVGKIHFSNPNVERDTEVILNVKQEDALFDIRAEILKKYIAPGGRVRANVSLINMGDLRDLDVSLEYKIIDYDRNVYSSKKEEIVLNQTYSNIFYLDTPKDIDLGNYLFYARVLYNVTNVSASSYDTFVVENVSFFSWILLIVFILVLMYLAYRWYKSKKYEIYEKFRQEELKKQEMAKLSGLNRSFQKREDEVPKLP